MLDLCSITVSISYLMYWYFSSMVRRRLHEVDGGPMRSLLIFNMPNLLKRYWVLTLDHHWSKLPVLGVCVSFLGVVISFFGVVLLLAPSLRQFFK